MLIASNLKMRKICQQFLLICLASCALHRDQKDVCSTLLYKATARRTLQEIPMEERKHHLNMLNLSKLNSRNLDQQCGSGTCDDDMDTCVLYGCSCLFDFPKPYFYCSPTNARRLLQEIPMHLNQLTLSKLKKRNLDESCGAGTCDDDMDSCGVYGCSCVFGSPYQQFFCSPSTS